MERRVLLDFLLEKHLLHTHKCFDDADYYRDIVLYNETRFIAVGSHMILIFILLMSIINYYYVCFKTQLENLNNSFHLRYFHH